MRPRKIGIVAVRTTGMAEPLYAPHGTRCLTPRQRRTILFFHQAQRRMPSLWLGWWWRGESDSGFEQKFAYLLPDKIAHPGGGDIACEQLDGMRPRPFSLLVGALTAGPTAEGWRPSAG